MRSSGSTASRAGKAVTNDSYRLTDHVLSRAPLQLLLERLTDRLDRRVFDLPVRCWWRGVPRRRLDTCVAPYLYTTLSSRTTRTPLYSSLAQHLVIPLFLPNGGQANAPNSSCNNLGDFPVPFKMAAGLLA